MAELNMPQKRGRGTKPAPRVDLTPMVDLGFLLITFFMYTTTMAKSKIMELKMPSTEPTDSPCKVIAESTITLMPTRDHHVVYYEGILETESQLKNCALADVRGVLLDKKHRVISLPLSYSPAAHKMYVLIKPANESKYGDVVQLLDEMVITGAPNYTIVDITATEQEWIKKNF
jgi:biopolymer transport protein ExbD